MRNGGNSSLGHNTGITVIDVMRELGVEITDELSWRAGAQARERWLKEFGTLPEKVLRPKTNIRNKRDQNGKHHFAVYPASWRPILALIIGRLETDRARQLDLFR